MSLIDIENAARGTLRTFIPGHEHSAPSSSDDELPASAFHTPSSPVGPPLVERLIEKHGAEGAARILWNIATTAKREDPIVVPVSGATDASGNLDLKIYDVPAGYGLTVTRVVIEAGGFTPAVPFSGGWVALIVGVEYGQGAVLDFGPATAGGQTFPGLFSDGSTQASRLTGGQTLSLHVASGPASTAITARMQGILTEL